ncbi:MAG: hypothetical protein JXB10_11950 [Pirellulales bacterium]|nr:hypothetical protein [Pirellulales bacterium]
MIWALGGIYQRAGATDQSVWQLTPYRVQIAVAGDAAIGSPEAAEAFRSALQTQLETVVGALWQLTVAPAPPALQWPAVDSMETLTAEGLLKPDEKADKIIVLTVTEEGCTLRVAARELDVRTRRFGPVIAKTVWQRGKLRDAATDAVLEAFAPLAMIDGADLKKGTVVLRLKAAALPPRDPNLVFVRPGTYFQPILRYNDRDGNPLKIEPLPWTIFETESVSPEQVACKLYTGLRAPPIVRRRGRMEQLALGVRPSTAASTLELRARAEPKPPLAGYEIYEQGSSPKDLKLLGRTDPRGRFVIPPGKASLRLLMVKNGQRPLSKPLPLVRGLEPELSIEIPSDDARLQAEGVVIGLVDELIDIVGRRKVLAARIKIAMKNNDWQKARQFLRELRNLPDGQRFLYRLADEKKRLSSRDRMLQKQIDELFNELQKNIVKYLSPEEIDALEIQLEEAQASKKK